MVATKKGRKPLNFHMCELVYTSIAMNLSKCNSTREAIYYFIEKSDTFKNLQEGKLYDDFINACLRNTPDKLLDYQSGMHDPKEMKKDMEEMGHAYAEPETGEFLTEEDLEEVRQDRDRIKLEIARIADPRERSDKTSTGLSDRAYRQIWRMCESYEKYCIETKQPGPLPLNIVKNLPPHIIK